LDDKAKEHVHPVGEMLPHLDSRQGGYLERSRELTWLIESVTAMAPNSASVSCVHLIDWEMAMCRLRPLVGFLAILNWLLAQAAPFAYIGAANVPNISVIDTATNAVVATIAVLEPVNGFAVSPNGSRLYAANSFHTFVVDTISNSVVATVTTGSGVGGYAGVAINPAGTRVYVTSNWNQIPHVLRVIDTTTNTVTASIPVGDTPVGVAVSPSGLRVYVANMFSNDISVIDAESNVVTARVDLTIGSPCGRALVPFGIALDPAGNRAYVANQNCMAADGYWYTSSIDTSSNTVLKHIASGTNSSPRGVAVSPDGAKVFVSNGAVIETATQTMVATFQTGSLNGLALTPDGTRIYLPNLGIPSSGSVSVVDTTSYATVATLSVGGTAMAFGKFIGPGSVSSPSASMTMRFTASGFPPSTGAAAPNDPVTGTIVWDAASPTSDIDGLRAITLTLDGHTYSVPEIGYYTASGWGVIGALSNYVSGIGSGTNDFYIVWNKANRSPITFAYASASRSGVWETKQFDSFSIEPTSSQTQNFQGLWWKAPAESESGLGINFAHQDDVIFATWYTYDLSGKAWWLSMTANKKADNVYSGTLYQTTGPPFNAQPFEPNRVTRTPMGAGTLTFTGARSGTFAYTVNGVSQTKAIVPQEFGSLPTCVWGAQPDLTKATNYQDLWWTSPPESESGWGVNFAH
jgi:YVTN family beta-propeller protein